MDRTVVVKTADLKTQEFDWGMLTWLVSKEVGNSETLTLGRCTLKPGAVNQSHYHPNAEEIIHIMQGSILHSIEDGKVVELNKGDTITVPANFSHCAKNAGDEDAEMIICFSSAERQTIRE